MREIIDLGFIRKAAQIIGVSSASSKVLAEYERRLADGEHVRIFQHRNSLLVGPPVTKPNTQHKED